MGFPCFFVFSVFFSCFFVFFRVFRIFIYLAFSCIPHSQPPTSFDQTTPPIINPGRIHPPQRRTSRPQPLRLHITSVHLHMTHMHSHCLLRHSRHTKNLGCWRARRFEYRSQCTKKCGVRSSTLDLLLLLF